MSIGLLLTFTAVFRVLFIGNVGFNSDEAVYSGQAAALFGDPELAEFFSIFRAHPLFLQTVLGSLFLIFGVQDVVARLFVSMVFGTGTILIAYFITRRFYGHWIAIAGAAILAVLPYHVIVSRQVLVDAPLAFFVALTIWFMSKTSDSEQPNIWLAATGLSIGFAAASKGVVGLLLVPVVGSYLLLTGDWRRFSLNSIVVAGVLLAAVLSPFVFSRIIFAPAGSGSYLLWQISRPPNHDAFYLLRVLVEFGSPIFIALALLGLALMVRRRGRLDILILLWVFIYFSFFQIWPTKLFQYLIVVVPGLSIAAGLGLFSLAKLAGNLLSGARFPAKVVSMAFAATVLLMLCTFLSIGSWTAIANGPESVAGSLQFDVEVQDFAGGRETGLWAKENTPKGSMFMTIGPSMGNILRFYGYRDSVALSVSHDPRKRNPAYVPVENPDLWIRQMGIHYVVWDAYSADRSAFYSARLMRYARKFDGVLVFGIYKTLDGSLVSTKNPPDSAEPRILVFNVHGGDPISNESPEFLTNPS